MCVPRSDERDDSNVQIHLSLANNCVSPEMTRPICRAMQADAPRRHSVTMDRMSWGKKRSVAAQAGTRRPASQPADDSAAELHFCCICGALLAGDLEDEINGEGRGRDICGDCNRTKNFETMVGNE